MTGLSASLRQQTMVVHAMVLRDMSGRYSQSRFGILLAIIEPVFMIASLVAIRYFIRGTGIRHGMPLLLFVVTGYLTYQVFRSMAGDAIRATSRRPKLFLPQITTLDVIVAKIISSTVISTGVLLICSIGAILLRTPPPSNLLKVIFAAYVGMWLGAGLGMVVGVAARFVPLVELIIGPLLRAGVFVSGAMFLASEMPPRLLPYVAWNPMFHVIELMREGWFSGYESPIASPHFVVATALILTAIGLWLERGTSGKGVA